MYITVENNIIVKQEAYSANAKLQLRLVTKCFFQAVVGGILFPYICFSSPFCPHTLIFSFSCPLHSFSPSSSFSVPLFIYSRTIETIAWHWLLMLYLYAYGGKKNDYRTEVQKYEKICGPVLTDVGFIFRQCKFDYMFFFFHFLAQPTAVVQFYPPASCTSLTLHSEWGLVACGTAHGFALFDIVQKKNLLSKSTLSPLGKLCLFSVAQYGTSGRSAPVTLIYTQIILTELYLDNCLL